MAERPPSRLEARPDLDEKRSYLVVDLTDCAQIWGVPFGKWGPFTLDGARDFVAQHPHGDHLWIAPSSECQ